MITVQHGGRMLRVLAMLGVLRISDPPGARTRLISEIMCMGSSAKCSISSQHNTDWKYPSGYGKRSFSASKISTGHTKTSSSIEVVAR